MVSIWLGEAARYHAVGLAASSRGSLMGERVRIDCGTTFVLVAQNLVPADSTKVVPQSIRTLSPISEPRLDAASATAWYLAASPNQIDTIEYAYLEGQQGAYVETRNGFDVDGVEIKCRLDFGAKAIDWRGLYRNPGA